LANPQSSPKAIANDGSQVIISTQSVALANCFEPDDFIVVDYEEGESKFERFGITFHIV
jgi:predicted ATPase